MFIQGLTSFQSGNSKRVLQKENSYIHRLSIIPEQNLSNVSNNVFDLIKREELTTFIEPNTIGIGFGNSGAFGEKSIVCGTVYTHQDSGSFLFESPTVNRYPRKVAPVLIVGNVYIAADAIILCGVRFWDNSMVAAGSVVSSDVPPNTLYAGVPAKWKKTFFVSDGV